MIAEVQDDLWQGRTGLVQDSHLTVTVPTDLKQTIQNAADKAEVSLNPTGLGKPSSAGCGKDGKDVSVDDLPASAFGGFPAAPAYAAGSRYGKRVLSCRP